MNQRPRERWMSSADQLRTLSLARPRRREEFWLRRNENSKPKTLITVQILFFLMQSLFTATTDFMYSPRGLPGCSMDFVSLHYQFSNIEFYEANTIQREANIKNARMRFKSNVTVQLLSSFQPSRLTVGVPELISCVGIVSSRCFLWSLSTAQHLHLRRRHPAVLDAANLDSHFAEFFFPSAGLLFVALFVCACVCDTTKTWNRMVVVCRMTLP